MKYLNKYKKFFENDNKDKIYFSDNKNEVINNILSLQGEKGFERIEKINDNSLKIYYNGGYNNVYNYECIVTIGNLNIIGDRFNYWSFEIKSDIHTTNFETEVLDGDPSGDFVDFFIDEHIRDVGNMEEQEWD